METASILTVIAKKKPPVGMFLITCTALRMDNVASSFRASIATITSIKKGNKNFPTCKIRFKVIDIGSSTFNKIHRYHIHATRVLCTKRVSSYLSCILTMFLHIEI